jgi:soluble P-type ATPase
MLRVDVPGVGLLIFEHLLLDLNGTISTDGVVAESTRARILKLSQELRIRLVTCDTRGSGARVAEDLGVPVHRFGESPSGEALEKERIALDLNPDQCVAIGNGNSDALVLKACRLGIAVLGREGLALAAANAADIVVPCVDDALDLLLSEKRLVATLRC